MADYKVINFNKEWFEEEIIEFLQKNPGIGFSPDNYKEFIKFCINREKYRFLEDKEKAQEFANSQ